jgi:hypothetical protein
MAEGGNQPYGPPEKIGDAIGTVVVIAVFAMLAWAVARNFL